MLNEIKSQYLSGKILIIFFTLMLIFSCSKKEPVIAWEKTNTFAEILDSAGDKYVMIDFVRDG